MGGGQHPPGATVLLALAVGGIIAIVAAGNSNQGVSIQVKHDRRGVFLHCKVPDGSSVLSWSKDGSSVGSGTERNGRRLFVGSAADDPRGLYQCYSAAGNASLQLYFRLCQYCVQLDTATLLGIVAADVVATVFLVGAMWYLAAQEPGRLSRASDKQALLAHDQLYQPLGERNNGQYSHIGAAKARRR
ncbi:PREDICTED: T-cell surface glycoprotein CD3 gamma chain [Gekko japonicus]|uniref:T-cell surface glycoprotein CD3 gamma chain n=1 Tax=Gekko japonicus TaxID=146911 RepID=A0ABM1K6C3_GEKJA|nr:PREDICTED: T-cell surface glycoprotein CD3 gamma chain [Gekko japonicus]